VPIPAAASLVGLQVTVQAGVVDAAGAGGGISLTDAEWIVLGA
jgi:hypothetical protein